MLTWRWDRDEDDVDGDSDGSNASIEECGDLNTSRDDDFIKNRDFDLQQKAQEGPLQDATSCSLDASECNVLDRFIDEGFCENVRGSQLRHLGLRIEKSRFGSTSGGGVKWERVELGGSERKQIGRTDERWSSRHNSHTISFRRMSNGG